jgi:energy-coupling factor transport system ATP-binding protein
MELVMEDVGFCYDRGLPTETRVFDSVSLTARSGELLSVVGRTGCGKTTLALLMAGLLKPTAGRVTLRDSRDIPRPGSPRPVDRAVRTDVVMVFQFPESQFFEMNVFSEIAFGPSRLGLKDEELSLRVESAMRRVNLEPDVHSDRHTSELSEGEKRRVAIASALSCAPHFLILDEPSISLDWEASGNILRILRELALSGTSVIIATHEVESAAALSDEVVVLAERGIAASGKLTPEEILGRM